MVLVRSVPRSSFLCEPPPEIETPNYKISGSAIWPLRSSGSVAPLFLYLIADQGDLGAIPIDDLSEMLWLDLALSDPLIEASESKFREHSDAEPVVD